MLFLCLLIHPPSLNTASICVGLKFPFLAAMVIYVSFDWTRMCPSIWSNIILVCVWGCFWMRWSFELVEHLKQYSPWGFVSSSNQLRVCTKHKGWVRDNSFYLTSRLQAGTSVFSRLWTWTETLVLWICCLLLFGLKVHHGYALFSALLAATENTHLY